MSLSFIVVSSSLSPESKSFTLAQLAVDLLKNEPLETDFIDLRDFNLPLCNGINQSAYAHPNVKEIHDRLLKADGIILAAPIYNFSVSASCKNLIELTGTPYKDILSGKAWRNKVIGFLGKSGSPRSLMAPLSFLENLMLDFKCTIVPHFAMTSGEDFKDGILSADTKNLVKTVVKETIQQTLKLKS